MIHVVTAHNAATYSACLAQFFRLRREIFIEEQGWDLSAINGEERDEYDDDQAIYLLNIGTDGSVVAGQRVRSTLTNSMLADKFPQSVAVKDRPIADDRTWEVTRGFAVAALRGAAHRQSRAAFRLGSLEIAHELGIDRLVGITDVTTLPWFFNMGYYVRLLGLPVQTGDGESTSVAFEIIVSAQSIAHMREVWVLDGPSCFAVDPGALFSPTMSTVVAHLARVAGAPGRAAARPQPGADYQ